MARACRQVLDSAGLPFAYPQGVRRGGEELRKRWRRWLIMNDHVQTLGVAALQRSALAPL